MSLDCAGNFRLKDEFVVFVDEGLLGGTSFSVDLGGVFLFAELLGRLAFE
jgi:hypothetical protein